ncbi:unnamed protein product [Rotaria sp. Silwood2]|nr:unnamed protein product [Rotaria sp. Silwood2]CAF3172925.1 unnamed protein product [Rotaria sp. Silwood2]CAF3373244.1 unnamed protein product [Rotaria sp. Silwood2]CAF3464898.1 unnamed protein product [Rotaria sp. Silwood2]CAF4527346.1 unnamed protein product [Rotaria sp. Silwood2]
MVDEYKQALGTEISWPAFTSTSKDPQVAECYNGNTLFVISMEETKKERSDISSISHYPDEQEVLLPQHSSFEIEKVEHNVESGTYLIDLKALP